ncbi:MAG: glycine--tRNA ligase [Candidatus Portnoybacteria bacterium CG_4_10_14_0_8_um_filter_40_50]|uniref:glycine--tRNA ligase n=1 Tax=Candidatus Portnoybacteria bacterium CG_4_10_14_0_8_um_filter_40_50 TaxID=1974800 RepID=A0A2M7QQB8_9BACT|nr:MAG: glycine--tRNA ligase [Candidatus Portnoybacteria bacterium CG_4_10_14_0_8_um_filter_40_50]
MENLMEKIVSLCKRRGFIFPSSEIYGGFASSYDFGPTGVLMKNDIKKAWWNEMLKFQENIVGLDTAILMSPKVWEASGHLTAGFADELIECKKCNRRFRYDQLEKLTLKDIEEELEKEGTIGIPEVLKSQGNEFRKKWRKCECGTIIKEGPRKFNLMMKTFVGPVEEEVANTYLRAETCQGIYINFENVLNSTRMKIPFGIAQIGKSFRNEITPKDFIYRIREFEQMEMQWFCHPKKADKFFEYWKEERMKWYLGLGMKKENLRFKEVPKSELPHYAKRAVDIEYKFPFGWKEIEGVHNRGDWDLSNHSKYSGKDLRYYDEEAKEKYFPYIVETSVGAERSLLAFLCDAYQEVKGGRTKTTETKKEIEILLKLDKKIAPIKIAILPLVRNKPELVKKAKEIYVLLKPHFVCQYDELGSIGRRYRRQDEIGTILAITIDFESLEQDDLTIRDRDTMSQERVKIKDLIKVLKEKLEN